MNDFFLPENVSFFPPHLSHMRSRSQNLTAWYENPLASVKISGVFLFIGSWSGPFTSTDRPAGVDAIILLCPDLFSSERHSRKRIPVLLLHSSAGSVSVFLWWIRFLGNMGFIFHCQRFFSLVFSQMFSSWLPYSGTSVESIHAMIASLTCRNCRRHSSEVPVQAEGSGKPA